MSEFQNLSAGDAVEKLRELVGAAPTCMFATRLTFAPFHVCPMHAQAVDDEGHLWFFSGSDSVHNFQIGADPRVQLVFANHSACEFLTVYGIASLSFERAKIDELWKPMVKAWFPGGKEDPNLTLIRVKPLEVHYWDTKDGKLVSIAKTLAAVVTGKAAEGGIEGELRVWPQP